MNRTFKSNKGIILGIILWGAFLNAFYEMGLPGILNLEPIHLIIQPLILVLLGTIWFGIRYIISDEQLKIKIGPFTTYTVDIENVESISRSYNPLSSPAPSLRRINLKLRNRGFLLISPANELQFIDKLTEVNPVIQNKVKNELVNGLVKFFYWLL